MALLASIQVDANVIYVMNTSDNGVGSLRDAILSANSGDTIGFGPGVTGVITLTTGELNIDADITINGPGPNLLAIDGNNAGRAFNIGPINPANVVIYGIAITNCTFAGAGGAILINGGSLTLFNCAFINNEAYDFEQAYNSTNAAGGAIYNNEGTLSISYCSFNNNSARDVGSFYEGTDGGAIFNNNGVLTLTASTFIGNVASDSGAICNSGGALTIATSTFASNMASSDSGGAIDNSDGSMAITASTFSGNSAYYAGGAVCTGTLTNLQAAFTNCTFCYNYTTGGDSAGGAIYNNVDSYPQGYLINNGSPLTIISCTISQNSAISQGGGIWNEAFTDNTAYTYQGPTQNLIMANTIVAANRVDTASGAATHDVSGYVKSLGYNFIGDGFGCWGFQVNANGDHVGGSDRSIPEAGPIDPGLAYLANNGGPTMTMALVAGSPCINQGLSFGLKTDQRGFHRPSPWLGRPFAYLGDGSDIGAYEGYFYITDWLHDVSLGLIHLNFQTISGMTNLVMTTSNLFVGPWTHVDGFDSVGTGGSMSVDLPINPGVPQQFFQLATPTPAPLSPLPASAYDSTLNPAYFNSWIDESGAMPGMGAWILTATTTNVSNAAFFVESSTNNATGQLPGIDMNNGTSWAMNANDGNLAVAYRGLTNSLTTGGVFALDMVTGNIDPGNSVGFVLRNGDVTDSPTNYTTGALFQFLYVGGDATDSYKVIDATGVQNIGLPWTSTALHVVFSLNTTNSYTLYVFDEAAGTTNTFSGTLAGNGAVDSIALFNNNAGPNADHNAYFNSLWTANQ